MFKMIKKFFKNEEKEVAKNELMVELEGLSIDTINRLKEGIKFYKEIGEEDNITLFVPHD